MKAQFDSTNHEQKLAFDMIAKTNNSFFLTGRAGTGKTTFLKMVQEAVDKSFVVVAPTGVAAVNAGGKTIHSFFGLPLGEMIFSGKASEEEFLGKVAATRADKTVEWQAYRRFVNNLKLAMPC